MSHRLQFFSILLISGAVFSFFTKQPATPAQQTKEFYLQQAGHLENEIATLLKTINTGDEKALQQQFIKVRKAYKEIEVVIEYYFHFYALKLNSPPINFYEEDEPDKGEQLPEGMQVIEGIIFPHYKAGSKEQLVKQVENLLNNHRHLRQTNESFAFTDEFIFDAIIEELYRIQALGLTGFDSQTTGNGLQECKAALGGVQKILSFYDKDIQKFMGEKSKSLFRLLTDADQYLSLNTDFNSFNRMFFITEYLNLVTKLAGEYKRVNKFKDNPSPMYYSLLRKDNSLFEPGAFDVYKLLDDNTSTPDKIEFGRQLFFDTQLSSDNKHSCASCHQPAKAFTDGLKTSIALDGHSPLQRNAPTLINAALQRNLFLDSRSNSLEDQVMQVLNNVKEMNSSAKETIQKIIATKTYREIYNKSYPDAQATKAEENFCNAIACYVRTLVSFNSKFDKQMQGQAVFSQDEVNGFNLFMGKAKCGTCHFMPPFSGAKPPRYYYTESEVIGVPATSHSKTVLDKDTGRFAVTQLPLHQFSFKTPTLRNIELTAPYMHNGVYKNLQQVMDFYNNGGGKGLGIAPKNQSLPFDKLHLTKKEKKDIITFLKTLTDTSISIK